MRVLLRDGVSRRYYAGDCKWVAQRDEAFDFRFIEAAINHNRQEQLGATHVVLAYNLPACNVTLPITNYNKTATTTSQDSGGGRGTLTLPVPRPDSLSSRQTNITGSPPSPQG